MWYSNSSDEWLNLIREGEMLCNVRLADFGSASDEENRKKIGDISAVWLLKAIRQGVKLFKKKAPNYAPAADAMLKFLDGNGDDERIPDEALSPAMRVSMIRAALEQLNEKGHLLWKPGQVARAGFDYTHYPTSAMTNYIDAQKNVAPLQHIIGGFTEDVWYEMNESGGIDVFAKFEDVYDWNTGNKIQISLDKFGLDSPVFLKIIRAVTERLHEVELHERIQPEIEIKDDFWKHLQDLGYAKPYKHYYEGKLFSFPGDFFQPGATPFQMIKTVGDLAINQVKDWPTMKKVIEGGFDSIENYSKFNLESIAVRIAFNGNGRIWSIQDISEMLNLFGLSGKEIYNPKLIVNNRDFELLDFFFQTGTANIEDFMKLWVPVDFNEQFVKYYWKLIRHSRLAVIQHFINVLPTSSPYKHLLIQELNQRQPENVYSEEEDEEEDVVS